MRKHAIVWQLSDVKTKKNGKRHDEHDFFTPVGLQMFCVCTCVCVCACVFIGVRVRLWICLLVCVSLYACAQVCVCSSVRVCATDPVLSLVKEQKNGLWSLIKENAHILSGNLRLQLSRLFNKKVGLILNTK